MKENLVSGTAWIMSATVASKLMTIIAQVLLGYYLSVENFGVYAVALGLTVFFSWMKNGAIIQLAVREAIAGGNVAVFCKYANIFNVFSGVGLLCLVWLNWNENNYLGFLLLSFAFAQICGLPQLKIRCYYSSLGKFKELGHYEVGLALLRNLAIVFGAIWLEDERCFAIAIIAAVLYDYWINYRYIRKLPNVKSIHFQIQEAYNVWKNGRWLLVGAIGSALIMQGVFFCCWCVGNDRNIRAIFFCISIGSGIFYCYWGINK